MRFPERGEIPLDNNRIEHAIRPLVIGRKAKPFSDTLKGAIAGANLYSLAETSMANSLELRANLGCPFAEYQPMSITCAPG
jgi:transposase